jgi:DEAD/DEAH box helicase domain-containing protein
MVPARRTDSAQDVALQSVLDRLTSGIAVRAAAVDVADDPDGWITAVRRLPAAEARYAPFPDALDGRLRDVLRSRGVEQLYTHQAEAIGHAVARRNVVITTPTASGKTLCYNAPVLSAVLQDPSARALYLFPTKALAQDQLAELHELADRLSARAELEIGVFTYDGDTPQDARRAIRGRAHVVLSNADMVHSGILPHHPRWAKLFENLRYVVIDELHAYRGVFGSHLTNVLRRLRRICRHYGSSPTFICSSATIANPRELAESLVEEAFTLVAESGAPRGEKVFLFVNPPVVNRQLGIRRSYLAEARRVAGEFLKRSLQVIVFAQSRLATEILTTYLKDDFNGPPGSREEIRGYRGGYLPQRRREIEKGLRQRARARHRHRRARRLRDGGLPRHDCGNVAASRTGRPARRAVGGGARGEQRAARPVRDASPGVLLRRLARARARQPRQPAHPGGPRPLCGLRAAVHRR